MSLIIDPVQLDFQGARARTLLEQKVRETIAKCGVPGVGVVLVTGAGARIITSTQGIRKLGASGDANKIQPHDKWCLGSVSKPVTGTAIGILIQKGVGGLTWTSTLKDVFPEITSMLGVEADYFNVTLELLIAHASGMPYNPSGEPPDQWFPFLLSVGLTDANLMERRRKFVYEAVKDKPLFAPGTGSEYGGGSIICAAMFEKRTGIRFEHLLKQHVYDVLGMSNSGFGVTSVGDLDGPWQHHWDAAGYALVANDVTHHPASDYRSHGVAGNYCSSAADMGQFIKELLRPDPVAMTLATRQNLLEVLPSTASATTRGAWVCWNPNAPATSDISHNGDIGSMYADVALHRSAQWGAGAFANANKFFGNPAVYDMHDAMRTLMDHWNDLCASTDEPLWECAHPCPALIAGSGKTFWLFTRKHSGALVRSRFKLGWPPEAVVEFPGGILTSGVGVAASSDRNRIIVVSRGTDNRIWRVRSTDGGTTWTGFEPILSGMSRLDPLDRGPEFQTGPAIAMDATGLVVHVFAVGMDGKMYRTRSIDGGTTWSNWTAIGAGIFSSQPAAACSSDGNMVLVFGRGMDYRIWRNVSLQSGASWQEWTPIGAGIFTSGPAACWSAGPKVYVVARGTDRAFWYNVTSNGGADWLPHWQQIPPDTFGTLTSAPAVLADGSSLHVVGLGSNFCPRRIHSTSDVTNWNGWSQIGNDFYL
jgi:CubicO group peptidase (beta-lactamase class C family)